MRNTSHPAVFGDHKVIFRNGHFFAVKLSDESPAAQGRETFESERERKDLVRRVGLGENGTYPGLVGWFARKMALRMEAARRGNSFRRRNRA